MKQESHENLEFYRRSQDKVNDLLKEQGQLDYALSQAELERAKITKDLEVAGFHNLEKH